MMLGRPSLRRRLILSYLVVVAAVIGATFVTVQVLVPQFFEQAVQQRLGPGPQNGQNQQSDETGSSGDGIGQGQGNRWGTTTTVPGATDDSPTTSTTSTTATTSTTVPEPTGSTLGPGDGEGQGSGGNPDPGGGSGGPGGNPDPGGSGAGGNTTTTIDAFAGPGIVAAPALAQQTEPSPIPDEVQQDYDRALTSALIVATIIGLAIALALGWPLTRRLLRTFSGIKEGAGKLAEGHYDVRVPVPAETELAEIAESVNTLADSLQRTEQSRARLVSDLAHEIRNPLSTIEGYMEGLIDGVLDPSRDTYEAIAAEAHRLKKLTWDLSTLSKAQEGAIEYDLESAHLGDVAGAVVDTLRPQFEINDVALVVDVSQPMPVLIDADRIAQTLTNLLGNALSHTPPQGQVTVTGSIDHGRCRIRIADSGDGIPESELETVFERFTRLDSTHSGTGIGLNIARTLARAHGGDVTASSGGKGQGATFELTLPLQS
jgi:histidine kinase